MATRTHDIRRKVHGLLAKLKPAVTPPIPVEKIARLLGADVRYEPFEGELSGMLFREKGRSVVGVNALHSRTRQRFTIAHELGHLLLHSDNDLFVDKHYRVRRDRRSSEASDYAEIQANAFAAELLMPTALLTADVLGAELGLDLENDSQIARLAARYNV